MCFGVEEKMNEKISSLIEQSEVSIMDSKCFKGYIDIEKFSRLLIDDVLFLATSNTSVDNLPVPLTSEEIIMKVKYHYGYCKL